MRQMHSINPQSIISGVQVLYSVARSTRELNTPANKHHKMLNRLINPESDAATTEVEAALCVRELDSRILRFESN